MSQTKFKHTGLRTESCPSICCHLWILNAKTWSYKCKSCQAGNLNISNFKFKRSSEIRTDLALDNTSERCWWLPKKSLWGVAGAPDHDDELSEESLPEDGRDSCDLVVRKAVRVRIKFMDASLGEDAGFFVQVLVPNENCSGFSFWGAC